MARRAGYPARPCPDLWRGCAAVRNEPCLPPGQPGDATGAARHDAAVAPGGQCTGQNFLSRGQQRLPAAEEPAGARGSGFHERQNRPGPIRLPGCPGPFAVELTALNRIKPAWRRFRSNFWRSLALDVVLITAVFFSIHAWQTRDLPIDQPEPATVLPLLDGLGVRSALTRGEAGVV